MDTDVCMIKLENIILYLEIIYVVDSSDNEFLNNIVTLLPEEQNKNMKKLNNYYSF